MNKISDYAGPELSELLTNAMGVFKEIENQQFLLQNKEQERQYFNRTYQKLPLWVPIMIGLFNLIICLLILEIFIAFIISAFVTFVISTVIYICRKKLKEKKDSILLSQCEEIFKKINSSIGNNNSIIIIPREYRSSFALYTMNRYIVSQVATTWPECAKIFMEDVHRWRMEKNSQQMLMLQEQIAISARYAK